jgi:hypothetical protein
MEKKSSWKSDMQPYGQPAPHGSAMLLCSPVLGIVISMTLLLGSPHIFAAAVGDEVQPAASSGAAAPCASTPSGAGSATEPCVERRVVALRT